MHQVALALDVCVKCRAMSKLVPRSCPHTLQQFHIPVMYCCGNTKNIFYTGTHISLTTHIQFISVSKTPSSMELESPSERCSGTESNSQHYTQQHGRRCNSTREYTYQRSELIMLNWELNLPSYIKVMTPFTSDTKATQLLNYIKEKALSVTSSNNKSSSLFGPLLFQPFSFQTMISKAISFINK